MITKIYWAGGCASVTYTKAEYDRMQKYIRKQQAEKVKFEDVGYDHFGGGENCYAAICPSCGLQIVSWCDADIPFDCKSNDPEETFHATFVPHAYCGRNNYCNRCGQKLVWR